MVSRFFKNDLSIKIRHKCSGGFVAYHYDFRLAFTVSTGLLAGRRRNFHRHFSAGSVACFCRSVPCLEIFIFPIGKTGVIDENMGQGLD